MKNTRASERYAKSLLMLAIEKKILDKVKADADAAGMARNVTVGRAATPGTPERTALDALMSAEVPPKRRR